MSFRALKDRKITVMEEFKVFYFSFAVEFAVILVFYQEVRVMIPLDSFAEDKMRFGFGKN